MGLSIDREKVINHFDDALSKIAPADWWVSVRKDFVTDAIAMLKEQEPKYGEWITIWREDDPDTSDSARCSVCRRISERPTGEYCKWCGAKMDL